jgi:hypothetical protein
MDNWDQCPNICEIVVALKLFIFIFYNRNKAKWSLGVVIAVHN